MKKLAKTKKAVPVRRAAPKSEYPKGWEWWKDITEFREKNKLHEIDCESHPQIFKVDQYVRQILDGLRGYRPDMLKLFNGSALNAFLVVIQETLKELPKGKPREFTELLCARVKGDIALRSEVKAGGSKAPAALAALRKRGLVR